MLSGASLSCTQLLTTLLLQLAAAIVSFATATVVTSLSTEGGVHEKLPIKRGALVSKGERHWAHRGLQCTRGAVAFLRHASKAVYKTTYFWS